MGVCLLGLSLGYAQESSPAVRQGYVQSLKTRQERMDGWVAALQKASPGVIRGVTKWHQKGETHFEEFFFNPATGDMDIRSYVPAKELLDLKDLAAGKFELNAAERVSGDTKTMMVSGQKIVAETKVKNPGQKSELLPRRVRSYLVSPLLEDFPFKRLTQLRQEVNADNARKQKNPKYKSSLLPQWQAEIEAVTKDSPVLTDFSAVPSLNTKKGFTTTFEPGLGRVFWKQVTTRNGDEITGIATVEVVDRFPDAVPVPAGFKVLKPAPPNAAPPLVNVPHDRPIYGVRINKQADGSFAIVQIQPGSPAEKAGLKQGDVIDSIDGAAAKDLSTEQALQVFRHPVVRLKIRDGAEVRMELPQGGVGGAEL